MHMRSVNHVELRTKRGQGYLIISKMILMFQDIILDGIQRADSNEDLKSARTTIYVSKSSPLVPILTYPSTVIARMKEYTLLFPMLNLQFSIVTIE